MFRRFIFLYCCQISALFSIYLSKNYVYKSACNLKVYNKACRNDDQGPLLIITLFIIYFNTRKEKTDIIQKTGIVEGNEANISTVIQGRISIL